MKKIILVVLLVLLAFTVWAVLVYGKAKEEYQPKPTQIQKTELSPGPEEFPAVVLPKPKPTKPTMGDFQKLMLEKKGITREMLEQRKLENVPAEGLETAEKGPLDLCTIGNQTLTCCYRTANDNPYLRCWGAVSTATYLDPDNQGYGMAACPYPIYPFNATAVAMAIYTDDTCTVVFQPEIWSVVYINGLPYPDAPIFVGPQYTFQAPGGTWTQYLSLGADVCLYGPWFAVITYVNTDDRYDSAYCPAGNAIPAYQSWIFDFSGRQGQSYWGPYAEYGLPYGWFDVVPNAIAPGAIRVRTQGYNRAENACPIPPDPWYFKDPYADAPSGMPDFYQYQAFFPADGLGNPGGAYDGPAAVANFIWWFAARGDFPPCWNGFTPADVPVLINMIAAYAGTDPNSGTSCYSLADAIGYLIGYGCVGWWFDDSTLLGPDFSFWDLQRELRACENIYLFLGFWQEDPPGVWHRFGGHFVTLAGVDIFNYAFAISDPAMGSAENLLGPGFVGSGGFNVPHLPIIFPHENAPFPDPPGPPPPPAWPGWHNDAGNVSHDVYSVAWPSPSPGGLLYLPNYVMMDAFGTPVWHLFNGKNFNPLQWQYYAPYNSQLPVHVEIDQVTVVSPGPYKMSGTVVSSKAYEVENNMGGIEAFGVDFGSEIKDGLYYGTFIKGNSQDNITCDYGDYAPLHTFKPLAAPKVDTFIIAGAAGDYTIQQLTTKFAHPILPLEITKYAFGVWIPQGGTEECEYAIEDVFVIQNTGDAAIEGLKDGMWLDLDISSGGTGDLADYNETYRSIWMYDVAVPGVVFGMTKKPLIVGEKAVTGYSISQAARVYDGQYMDSLYYYMENLGWGMDDPAVPEDRSILLVDTNYTLAPGEMRMEKYLKWGYVGTIAAGGDDPDWRTFLYLLLYQEGFYRGDVNQDGRLTVSDVIYLINYLFKGGPSPIEFVSQGDVQCDGKTSVSDVVYIINYLFKGGPAPIDKNRFLLESPFVDPAHKALGIRIPGLFGDPVWRTLHP